MEELIARITASAGIDAPTAQKAVGIILGFLKKEGPPAEVGQLMSAIPGAEAAADAAAPKPAGGLMGGLTSMMGGGGGLMGLASQLSGAGLGMGEMQSVGKELFAYGREKVGEDTMGQIAGAIPGMSQFS